MTDATLAQGNGVLFLILQKNVSKNQLQDLLSSGVLADVLDANIAVVDRVKLRDILGLKPVICIEEEVVERTGTGFATRDCAFLRDEPKVRTNGTKSGNWDAVETLLLLLHHNLGRSGNRSDYAIEDLRRITPRETSSLSDARKPV